MKHNLYGSVALLGTSADPPTTGHNALLIGLSEIFSKVVTWASSNPSKTHKTSLNQRLELLNALVQQISVPNIELKQELSSKWAIDTLELAKKYWPNENLVLVIGSDLIQDIPNWVKAKDLIKKAHIGIVPRYGWPIDEHELKKIHQMGGQTSLLPLDIPPSASSAIHNGPNVSQIPKAILPILKRKQLYGFSQNNQ